jgi:CO/xanthine dehydrogenase FAD-binding subunit
VQAAEAHLVGKALTEDAAAQAARIALEGAKQMGQNGYKIPLTQTLIRRALAKLNA